MTTKNEELADFVKEVLTTVRFPQGEVRYRVLPDNTHYHAETPPEVVELLQLARKHHYTLALHYGDTATGRDWLEENETRGKIGRSTGPVQVPLLIEPGEIGGGSILDHCLVKIRRIQRHGREVTLWQAPNYLQPEGEIVPCHADYTIGRGDKTRWRRMTHAVHVFGQEVARFQSLYAARRYADRLAILLKD